MPALAPPPAPPPSKPAAPATPAPADRPTQIDTTTTGHEPSPDNYMGNIGEDLADLDDASGPSPSHVAPKP